MERRAVGLITGAPRSGTTWAGRLAAAADGVAALHEPLNPVMTWTWPRVPRHFTHIGSHNGAEWEGPVGRALRGEYPVVRNVVTDRAVAATRRHLGRWASWRRAARSAEKLIVKDPIAIFSSEWLADTFDLRTVVLVRHPAGVVSSLVRMGWRPRFEDWAGDAALLEGLLAPLAGDVRRAAQDPPPLLEAAALLWATTAAATAAMAARRPDWMVLRYEDLALDPHRYVPRLVEQLGIPMTPAVASEMERSTTGPAELAPADALRSFDRDSQAAAMTWQHRLSDDDLRRVRVITERWAAPWFDDEDWKRSEQPAT